MTKNILIGFLAGIVLCGGIICVLTVMDDTIKSEDDVEKYLGVPVWLLFRIERTILTRTEEKVIP